jgi:hypothetical protein
VRAAFSSCLPCLRTSHSDTDSLPPNDDNSYGNGTRGVRRARPNELEGLLADVGDTDMEGETLSLHSNIGNGERRRKRRRGIKRITVFGWNLFGRPPIQLPDDDGEDELLRHRRDRRKPTTSMSSSNSTLDSDAAPLDPAAIESLQITSAQLDERAAAADAEDKRLKEERRQLRRERKEVQKMARALALANNEAGSRVGDGFEGFPGSGTGSGHPQIPSPFQSPPPSDPPAQLTNKDASLGGIAGFFKGEPIAEADSDDADLGGQSYARRTTSGNSNGSDSRSRSSASQSNPDQLARYNHHYMNSQPSPHMVPLPHSARSDSFSTPSEPPRKTKSSKSKSQSSTSHSSKRSSSTSQSPSLPSPVGTTFPVEPTVVLPHSSLSFSTPREEFEGFPIDSGDSLRFPSPGIGGGRGKGRDMGAFLADRGDA